MSKAGVVRTLAAPGLPQSNVCMMLLRPDQRADGEKSDLLMRCTLTLAAALATIFVASHAVRAHAVCDRALEQPQRPPVVIGFSADSADLSEQERTRLERVVPQYLAMPDLKLCIIAQADGQGDGQYNRRLAERRAEAVAAVLTQAGLSNKVILLDVGSADEAGYHALERRILLLEAAR